MEIPLEFQIEVAQFFESFDERWSPLLERLDAQKEESVGKTYQLVNKHFAGVFQVKKRLTNCISLINIEQN